VSEINASTEVPKAAEKPVNALSGAMAKIGEQHKKLRSQKTLALKVPGYEDLMQIRYRLLPETEMDGLAKRLEAVKDEGVTGSWEAEAETLVKLCDRIEVRETPEDGWEVLQDENGPIRFGASFAKALEGVGVQVESARARETVVDFFSPREDPKDPSSPRQFPNAMERHTNAIILWNRNQTELIARDLLGN
jgi:hypothetical protein